MGVLHSAAVKPVQMLLLVILHSVVRPLVSLTSSGMYSCHDGVDDDEGLLVTRYW